MQVLRYISEIHKYIGIQFLRDNLKYSKSTVGPWPQVKNSYLNLTLLLSFIIIIIINAIRKPETENKKPCHLTLYSLSTWIW